MPFFNDVEDQSLLASQLHQSGRSCSFLHVCADRSRYSTFEYETFRAFQDTRVISGLLNVVRLGRTRAVLGGLEPASAVSGMRGAPDLSDRQAPLLLRRAAGTLQEFSDFFDGNGQTEGRDLAAR